MDSDRGNGQQQDCRHHSEKTSKHGAVTQQQQTNVPSPLRHGQSVDAIDETSRTQQQRTDTQSNKKQAKVKHTDKFASLGGNTQITFSQMKAFSSPLPIRRTFHQLKKMRGSVEKSQKYPSTLLPHQDQAFFTCHCGDTGRRRRTKLYRQKIEDSDEYRSRARKIEQSEDPTGFWASCYAGFREDIQRGDEASRRPRAQQEGKKYSKSRSTTFNVQGTTTMLTYGHFFGGRSDGAVLGFLLSKRMGQYAFHERILGWHAGQVTSMWYLEFCEDYFGGLLFSGSIDSRIHIWDPWAEYPQPMLVQTLSEHTGAITQLQLMGLQLVSSSYDGACILWNPDFHKECSRPYYLCYTPFQRIKLGDGAWACGASLVNVHLGRTLVIGDSIGRIHLYLNSADRRADTSVVKTDGFRFEEEEKQLLSGRYDKYKLYTEIHKLRITYITHLENTSHIATIATDHTCKITDIVSGRILCTVVHPAFRPILPSLAESMTMSRTAARVSNVIAKAADRMVGKKSGSSSSEGLFSVQISKLADELISENADAALGSSRVAKMLSDCIFVCCEWDEHYQQLYLSDKAGRLFVWNIYSNVCLMQANLKCPKQAPHLDSAKKEAEQERSRQEKLSRIEKSMAKAGHLPVADCGILDEINTAAQTEEGLELGSKEASVLVADVDDVRRKYYSRALRIERGCLTDYDSAVSSQHGKESYCYGDSHKVSTGERRYDAGINGDDDFKDGTSTTGTSLKHFVRSLSIRREEDIIYLSVALGNAIYELSIDRTSVTAWKKHHTGSLLGLHIESPESAIQTVDSIAKDHIVPGMCRYRRTGAVTRHGILLSASRDNSLVCWDLWNMEPLYRLVAFRGRDSENSLTKLEKIQKEITSLSYVPDPELLITGHGDGTLLLWKKDTKEQERYTYHQSTISSVTSWEDRDGNNHVVTADYHGMVCIWKQNGGTLTFAKKTHIMKDTSNLSEELRKIICNTPQESKADEKTEKMLYNLKKSGTNVPRIRTIQAALSATKGRRGSLLGKKLSARLSVPIGEPLESSRRVSTSDISKEQLQRKGVAITTVAMFLPVNGTLDDLLVLGCEDGQVRILLASELKLLCILDTANVNEPLLQNKDDMRPVVQVCCNRDTVSALTSTNELFTWSLKELANPKSREHSSTKLRSRGSLDVGRSKPKGYMRRNTAVEESHTNVPCRVTKDHIQPQVSPSIAPLLFHTRDVCKRRNRLSSERANVLAPLPLLNIPCVATGGNDGYIRLWSTDENQAGLLQRSQHSLVCSLYQHDMHEISKLANADGAMETEEEDTLPHLQRLCTEDALADSNVRDTMEQKHSSRASAQQSVQLSAPMVQVPNNKHEHLPGLVDLNYLVKGGKETFHTIDKSMLPETKEESTNSKRDVEVRSLETAGGRKNKGDMARVVYANSDAVRQQRQQRQILSSLPKLSGESGFQTNFPTPPAGAHSLTASLASCVRLSPPEALMKLIRSRETKEDPSIQQVEWKPCDFCSLTYTAKAHAIVAGTSSGYMWLLPLPLRLKASLTLPGGMETSSRSGVSSTSQVNVNSSTSKRFSKSSRVSLTQEAGTSVREPPEVGPEDAVLPSSYSSLREGLIPGSVLHVNQRRDNVLGQVIRPPSPRYTNDVDQQMQKLRNVDADERARKRIQLDEYLYQV